MTDDRADRLYDNRPHVELLELLLLFGDELEPRLLVAVTDVSHPPTNTPVLGPRRRRATDALAYGPETAPHSLALRRLGAHAGLLGGRRRPSTRDFALMLPDAFDSARLGKLHRRVPPLRALDYRSLYLNFEETAVVADAQFAKSVEAMLVDDLARCDEVPPGHLEGEPLHIRVQARVARLASPLL